MTDLTRAPSGDQVGISHRDQRAVVLEVGGGLRTYSVGGRELLDGYRDDKMSTSGRGQVLLPWPSRIRGASYEFDRRRHQLPINDLEEQDAIHGLVRWAAWRVGEQEPDRVVTSECGDKDGRLGDPSVWVDDSYGYLMLFTGDPLPDVKRRSLAVEPMTCPPNAFQSGEGLIRLDPGRSFTSTWGIKSGP
jgi:galactose mutarotase-like enzyme